MGVGLIVFEMDILGGFDMSMWVIIKDIFVFSVFVVSYVGLSGVCVVSVGIYIMYVSYVVVMVLGINLGLVIFV